MNTLNLVRAEFYGTAQTLLSDQSVVSPSEQLKLAGAYLNLPEFDERALPAWTAMAYETNSQRDRLVALGFTFSVSIADPYVSAADMLRDVEENRHIACLSTEETGRHPFFTFDENDAFRQVHDVLGHFAAQRGFDRHGEEAAYRRHSLTYSHLARKAMATETRGQNAALIATGKFQAERIAVLPTDWRMSHALTPCGPDEWREAGQQARTMHSDAGLAWSS